MFSKLAEFYVLWFIILIAFSSVGLLLFGELADINGHWTNIYQALFMMFDYSLGSWDPGIYCGDETGGLES